MKEKLLAVFKSPVVRKAFYALVLAVAGALGYAQFGCSSQLRPEVATFECQLAALETVVPKAAAEDLVMAARNGAFEYLIKSLLSLGAKTEEIQAAADMFNACSVPEPVPQPAEQVTPAGVRL